MCEAHPPPTMLDGPEVGTPGAASVPAPAAAAAAAAAAAGSVAEVAGTALWCPQWGRLGT